MSPHFHSLSILRTHLNISPLNTGCRIELYGPAGPITDDIECLHAVTDEYGRVRLSSGVEFSAYMYRGQTRDHGTCTPTLTRLKTPEKQLLALCQRIAFEDAIGEHPLVQLAERTQFLNNQLYVDREGLAQHYGLATDMLDITSNFDIATFFATCNWNENLRQFEPFSDMNVHGVIYRICPVFLDIASQQDSSDDFLHIVGWQPFPRPELQRAFAVKLRPGQDFSNINGVEIFRFSHDVVTSHSIWEAFDQGRVLFPTDAAAELSIRAKSLFSFTAVQIELAWQKLGAWTGNDITPEFKAKIESQCSIQRTPVPSLNWNGLLGNATSEQLQKQMGEVLSRVRFRLAAYL